MNTTETTSDTSKLVYMAPKLTVVGSFEEVTQATHSGNHLDAGYPRGTPITNPIIS